MSNVCRIIRMEFYRILRYTIKMYGWKIIGPDGVLLKHFCLKKNEKEGITNVRTGADQI